MAQLNKETGQIDLTIEENETFKNCQQYVNGVKKDKTASNIINWILTGK